MNKGAIIQARMGSTRLPGKVLKSLAGKSSIKHIVERLNRCANLDKIIVATTHAKADEAIICETAQIVTELNAYTKIAFFRGSEDDVLKRVYECAVLNDLDVIVDVTADCPIVDPVHVDFLINKYLSYFIIGAQHDCYTNCATRSWPDGLDIIVYPIETLKQIHSLIDDPMLRQHAGWNIFNMPDTFNIYNWKAPKFMRWHSLGITLDTQDDYLVLNNIFEHFKKIGKGNAFTAEEVIYYLRENPGIITNHNVVRKKGGSNE